MIRDFSEEKRKELYDALEIVDNKEWKPFMAWCGGRAGEFGVWADRLGISSYTRRIDDYQNRILDTNNSTRNQIDVIFDNVAETDIRYAEIFRGYAEIVKEQVAQIQALAEVMRSVNRSEKDGDVAIILQDLINALSVDISIEKFEQMVQDYIQGNDVTYEDLCEYLDLLVEEHYLTQSECVAMKGYISNLGHVPSSVEDVIKNNISELLSNKKAYIALINKKIKEAKQGMSSDNPKAIVEYRLLNIYRNELLDGMISLNEIEEVINILEEKDPQIFTDIGTTYIYDTSVCDDLVQRTIAPYIFANEHVSVELLNELDWAYVNEEHVKELRLVMIKYDITTVERLRHFLAQCDVESGITADLLEIGHGADTDYYPYYGAGRIQLTHDYGYYAFAIYKALECYPELEDEVTYYSPAHSGSEEIFAQYDNLLEAANNRNLDISEFTNIVDIGPEYVAENYAWESAAYFWAIGGCNEIVDSFTDTDKSNVDAITSVVNFGDAHYKEKREAYETIKEYIQ